MYLFLSCQTYRDGSASFDIEFWYSEDVGVIGVDSEQYDTYSSCAEIDEQNPSNAFDFYGFDQGFRVANINEVIKKKYLPYIDGYKEVDKAWKSGLKFDDYVKKVHYFEDSKERDEFIEKILNR